MAKTEPKRLINDLRKNVQNLRSDLDQFGDHTSEIPELIISANLLRSNEYLSKINDKKTELLTAYAQYSDVLEELLSATFDIQNDLKEILRDQSSLISKTKKRPKIIKSKKYKK